LRNAGVKQKFGGQPFHVLSILLERPANWTAGFEIWGPKSGDQTKRNLMPSSSVLSRLKDGKAVGVVDEDAPEKPRTQDTIEPLYIGALLGGSTEEGYAGQLE
jgi:hypothetical protein